MIDLLNLRLGFATNSSSTHSIVLFDGEASDYDVDGDFGWNFFTAASKKSKMRYLAVMLDDSLGFLPDRARAIVVKKLLGIERDENWYIDHQSEIKIPLRHGTGFVDERFLKDMKALFSHDKVAIIGGSDNDEELHELVATSTIINIPKLEGSISNNNFISRKSGDVWVVFNKRNGSKVRFTLNPRAATTEVVKTPLKGDF